MPHALMNTLKCLACASALSLVGCAQSAAPGDDVPLAELVVTDPDFDFATTRTVRVELTAAEGAAPQAIEVSDSEGRRLMDGAFRSSVSMDLKVPVGRADTLQLRTGQGAQAVQRQLTVNARGVAGGDL